MFVKINLLLAVVILMLACGIYGSYAAGTVSHPASQIEPGTFGVGNFVFPQNLNITNNFTVDAGIFYVDSNNDRVGIGTTEPGARLTVQTTGTTDILNLLETGGTEVFTVLESGYVGIGATDPRATLPSGWNDVGGSYALQIESGAATYDAGVLIRRAARAIGLDLWIDGSTGTGYIDNRWNNDKGNIQFRAKTSGTPVDTVTIKGSGNVGIGTTSPTQKLEVSGGTLVGVGAPIYSTKRLTVIGNSFDNTALQLENTDVDTSANGRVFNLGITDVSSTEGRLDLTQPGTRTVMSITSTGKVGIGTTGPGGKLEVVGASVVAAGNSNVLNLRQPSDGGVNIRFGNSAYDLALITGGVTSSGAGTNDGILAFSTSLEGTLSEQMRIDKNGNVGIGTTAPNSTLHVVGIVNATQGFAYGLSAARPAAKEGVVWWNVSAGFHCPQWYNSTHWICNTGAATRADPV